MAEKNYIGWGAKEIQTQYGSIINLNLKQADLKNLPLDNYGNIKLTVLKRREESQYGDTHYVVENTFVSKSSEADNADDDTEVEWAD